jgi:hypothetical protein
VSNPTEGIPTDLYIGGKFVSSSDGGRFDVIDPATGSVLASVADGTEQDASSAVDAAADAAADWANTPPRERSEILRKAFGLDWRRSSAVRTARRSLTHAGRSPTPPSSSGGTPRKRSVPAAR